MPARTFVIAAFTAVLVFTLSHGRATPQQKAELKADIKTDKARKITDLLAKRVSLDPPFDGKFKDALEMLTEKYRLPIVIDPSVREFAGAGMACDGLEDKTIKLPRMLDVRTDTLLRLTCQQADAMYLVYPDYIRIVPTLFGLYESGVVSSGPDASSDEAPLLDANQLLRTRPLTKRAIVNLSFSSATVSEILDEIAAASGANVALAPLVADKGAAKLTVRFANTPVDSAVRTICEMTDLDSIEDANVLIVTTHERAAARRKADLDKKRARIAPFAGFAGFGGNGLVFANGLGGAALPDWAGEIAKLKEQNEQLKKQLDEVLKLVKK
jgi:hypothetical protein